MRLRPEMQSSLCARTRHNFLETSSCSNRLALRARWRQRARGCRQPPPRPLRQQPLNQLLGLVVLALAETVPANASARINEVECRPIVIVEGAPDRVVVIDRDGVFDVHLPHRTTDVVDVPFERELGRVYTDDDELLLVLLRPG